MDFVPQVTKAYQLGLYYGLVGLLLVSLAYVVWLSTRVFREATKLDNKAEGIKSKASVLDLWLKSLAAAVSLIAIAVAASNALSDFLKAEVNAQIAKQDELYSQALNNIAGGGSSQRLAGIYLMVSLAEQSPKYHWYMLQLFPALMREWGGSPQIERQQEVVVHDGKDRNAQIRKLRADKGYSVTTIETALRAIGSRKLDWEDVSGTDLSKEDQEPSVWKEEDVKTNYNGKISLTDFEQTYNSLDEEIKAHSRSWKNDEESFVGHLPKFQEMYVPVNPLEELPVQFECVKAKRWMDLSMCRFAGTAISRGAFDGITAQNSDFNFMTAPQIHFARADLSDSSFAYAEIPGTDFRGSIVTRCIFANANIDECRFDYAWAPQVDFRLAALFNVDFRHCFLLDCDFRNCLGCPSTRFDSANLWKSNFRSAIVGDKDRQIEGMWLSGFDVSNESFKSKIWRPETETVYSILQPRALLKDTGLTSTEIEERRAEIQKKKIEWQPSFKSAYCKDCDFSYSYLWNVDFTGADLRGCHFDYAFLGEAKLDAAHLEGVDLSLARGLTKSQVKAAKTDQLTKFPVYLR